MKFLRLLWRVFVLEHWPHAAVEQSTAFEL
jgi:hypothetical protein